MSITIINSKQINDEKDKLSMHFLPAKINGDGEANVEKYFAAYTRRTENGFYTNSLRGYPLVGKTRKIPTHFKGFVLQETRKPLDEEADRTLRVKGTFEEFTYWNYDKIPSASDGYNQALQLLDIASVLSEPIDETDVLNEVKENTKLSN